jgi:hypothetical protein
MNPRSIVFALSVAVAAAVPAVAADATLTKVTTRDLVDILNQEGFRGGEPLEEKGEEYVRINVEGHPVVFILTRNGGDLMASTGFKESKATVQRANDWNKSKRYTRVFLDEKGTAFMRMDLDLSKGITRATLADYLTTFLKLVVPFRKQVCE